MEKTTAQLLTEAGFTVTKMGDDAFDLKSEATGAVVKRNATERDLSNYLACINYVKVERDRAINVTYSHANPVHR